MLFTEDQAKGIVKKVLSFVKAEDAEVSISAEKLAHLRFARNAFLTSGSTSEQNVSLTVWVKGRRGGSRTSDLSEAGLKRVVAEAEQVASISPVDREYVETLGPQEYRPVNAFSDSTLEVSLDERAKRISSIINRAEKTGVICAGFHEAQAITEAQATRNGNFGFEERTVASLSVTARTKDGSSSGFFQRSSVGLDLLDTERIAAESIAKCLNGRNARSVDPGEFTVILEPQAVGDLLGGFTFQFNARSAEEGRSAFSAPGGKTRLGERLFDKRINIYSDPWNKDLPGSPIAQDGIPAQKLYFVRNGVLENLIYNRFWAKKTGKDATPGPVNVILESTGKPGTLEEMIATTAKGLLIGRFWYIRSTDPRTASSTGLTRDGVWFIENGKIKYPVNNLRFNQSMIDMLGEGNVEMIGVPERIGVGRASLFPALKIRTFSFTSRSEAV